MVAGVLCGLPLTRFVGAQPDERVEGQPAVSEGKKVPSKGVVLGEADLERIQRRMDQLTEQHQKLTQAIEEIKAELAIIKVRVTN